MTKEKLIALLKKAYKELSPAQDNVFFIGNWYDDLFIMMRNDVLYVRPDGYAFDLNPDNPEEFKELMEAANVDDLIY